MFGIEDRISLILNDFYGICIQHCMSLLFFTYCSVSLLETYVYNAILFISYLSNFCYLAFRSIILMRFHLAVPNTIETDKFFLDHIDNYDLT